MESQEQQQVVVPPESPDQDFAAYSRALDEDLKKKGIVPDPEAEAHPVTDFWQKLLHGVPGKSRAKEITRSVARGAVGAAKELQETVEQHTKDSNPILSVGAKLGAKVSSKVQEVFGAESEDPLASFAEGVTQFTLPFAAGGALGFESMMGRVAGGAARGAVVDYAAFDAHGGNIGDIIKLIPDKGAYSGAAHAFGEMLSVDADDSEQVGKLKNAAAGLIPGVLLDGVIAGVRMSRGAKAGDKAVVEANAKILKDIADGNHVPEGAHARTVDNGDGTFSIKPTNGEGVPDVAPRFETRQAAEQQVETINFAMNEHMKAAKNAGGLTEGAAQEVRQAYQRMITSPGPVDMQKLLEGTHFNFSYMNEPRETLAMIESISEVFETEIKAARGGDGISHARQIELANEILGSIHPDQIPGVMAKVVGEGTTASLPARLLATNFALREVGGKAAKLFDMIEARPNDPILWEQGRLVARNLLELQEAMASASANTGRALEIHKAFDEMAETGGPKGAGVKPETKPSFDSPKAKALENGNGKKAPKAPLDPIAGMDQREIQEVLRMAKMAGGEPRNVFAIGKAARMVAEQGMGRKVLEFFVNSLLSSPVTPATAIVMNAAESTYRAVSKMVGGTFTGNGAMLREGWDILYANERYLADNFKTAVAAARAGRSVINPAETHVAIQGQLGEAIRTPSKMLMFADEFTRVSNYRSYIRAKSLRYWREKGLKNAALFGQVEKDLAAAFDSKTGIATIPAALKYAEGPTFSAPLEGSIGKNLSTFLNNTVEAKFVAPFVKTSVNIFNMTLDRTPGINLFLKRNREVLLGRKGKEAAADLWAQTAMAGSVFAYAYFKAKAGEVTGRAPKDPALRKLWLQDHREYSIKVDGKWVSFRRGDPLFTPLGLVADAMMIMEEADAAGNDADAGDIAMTSVAALAASFSNKTYMQGMTQFFEAWSSGEGPKMRKWLYGMGTAFTAPSAVGASNADPYYREVNSFIEATMSRYPGLSEKLPARYNIFGEPDARYVSLTPFPDKGPANETVASDLLSIRKGFAAPPRKVEGVDLGDREKFAVAGVTPWDRLHELIREPKGRPPLRDALETLVNSPKWQSASEGSIQFPGGERWQLAADIIDSYQQNALRQVEKEFPALREELKIQRKLRGASFRDGQAGAEAVLDKAGR